jgi:hypothetical protein
VLARIQTVDVPAIQRSSSPRAPNLTAGLGYEQNPERRVHPRNAAARNLLRRALGWVCGGEVLVLVRRSPRPLG